MNKQEIIDKLKQEAKKAHTIQAAVFEALAEQIEKSENEEELTATMSEAGEFLKNWGSVYQISEERFETAEKKEEELWIFNTAEEELKSLESKRNNLLRELEKLNKKIWSVQLQKQNEKNNQKNK